MTEDCQVPKVRGERKKRTNELTNQSNLIRGEKQNGKYQSHHFGFLCLTVAPEFTEVAL